MYVTNMFKQGIGSFALVCGAVCGAKFAASAASVSDYAVRVSAEVQTNSPRITLAWPADPGARLHALPQVA